ncbi:hypothetical protein [Rubrivirga marina]|uniref:Peptidase M6-like domain-containing protein n=1 Tax=Rubrivirga marina TaxID=1196024 RepID=A0A271J2A0_9BACT|nr:hypothetical protein [Rubrivirga marina]PAP77573.1 hypothetical protein BSZ37_14540 [Rubrivirga marina]
MRFFPLAVLLLAPAVEAQHVCLTPGTGQGGGLPGTGTRAVVDGTPGSIAFEDSVHALVVFVRFENDTDRAPEWPIRGEPGVEPIPDWGGTLLKENPADVTGAMGLDDPTLSAYFFWQSQSGPEGPHVLTGEVWPRDRGGRPHVFTPSKPSAGYQAGRESGYGYLVAELFDALDADPRFDPTRFDANRDGELDHLMLVVRRDPDVRVTGGVAGLSGVNSPAARTFGRPAAALTVGRRDRTVTVDMNGSGAINWVGGEYSAATLIHEYGHVLFSMGHTRMITPEGAAVRTAVSNDVPYWVPEGTGAYACAYNRMCGGGARGDRPYESSGYDVTLTLSGLELRRMGWARRTVLDPSRDTTGVRLRTLYGSGEVALIPLRDGSGADTLSLENRQRNGYFDRFPSWDLEDPYYGLVNRDLPSTGLLATLSYGDPAGPGGALYDIAPPSNRFRRPRSRCDGTSDGCVDPYVWWARDMLRPGPSATQMTPWTRPNVSGYTHYPEGFEPNWFAVTNVRHDGDDGTMAFDVVADVREWDAIVITADSWMGAESDGLVFDGPVRVTDGATLRVEPGTTVTFAGGLVVDEGARVLCLPGATCVGAE